MNATSCSANNCTRYDSFTSLDQLHSLTQNVLHQIRGKRSDNSPIVLKVVTVREPPFVIMKRRASASTPLVVSGQYEVANPHFEFDGYLPELLDRIVTTLNAKTSSTNQLHYQFINNATLHDQGFYGYTSTVEMLSQGDDNAGGRCGTAPHVCWAPYWLVASRFGKNIKWLTPHLMKGTGLTTKKASKKGDNFFSTFMFFFKPLGGTVWLGFAICCMVTTFLLVNIDDDHSDNNMEKGLASDSNNEKSNQCDKDPGNLNKSFDKRPRKSISELTISNTVSSRLSRVSAVKKLDNENQSSSENLDAKSGAEVPADFTAIGFSDKTIGGLLKTPSASSPDKSLRKSGRASFKAMATAVQSLTPSRRKGSLLNESTAFLKTTSQAIKEYAKIKTGAVETNLNEDSSESGCVSIVVSEEAPGILGFEKPDNIVDSTDDSDNNRSSSGCTTAAAAATLLTVTQFEDGIENSKAKKLEELCTEVSLSIKPAVSDQSMTNLLTVQPITYCQDSDEEIVEKKLSGENINAAQNVCKETCSIPHNIEDHVDVEKMRQRSKESSNPNHSSGSLGSTMHLKRKESAVKNSYYFGKYRGSLKNQFYDSWIALFALNWYARPRTASAKIVSLGFAFVCMCFVAVYTASLTNIIMKEEALVPGLKSFEELYGGSRTSNKICTIKDSYYSDILISKFPEISLDRDVVHINNLSEGLQKLRNNLCGGIAYDEPTSEYFTTAQGTSDVVYLPATVFRPMPYTMGFRTKNSEFHRLEPAFSYLLTQYHSLGFLETLYDCWFKPGGRLCVRMGESGYGRWAGLAKSSARPSADDQQSSETSEQDLNTEESSDDVESLEFKNMVGLFTLYTAVIFIGLAVRFWTEILLCRKACKRAVRKVQMEQVTVY